MKRFSICVIALSALLTSAQTKEEIFGKGKPPNFREEAMDRKFAKSKFAKMLKSGTTEPGCIQLMGGMFVALAEMGANAHKRDENFTLDPVLVDAVNYQLSTPQFPGMAYLISMVRRMMIEKRLPDEWLETAKNLNSVVKIIDIPKLTMLNEQINMADSAAFTIPLLKDRYFVEAIGANSAVTTDVMATFRDTWLDRDVVWSTAQLLDIGINQPKGKKKKKYAGAEAEELVAILAWYPPDPRKTQLDLLSKAPVVVQPVIIYARLASKQYADIEKFFKGQRVMLKGRFWEMNKTVSELEVRDVILFNENDWSQGVVLGNPNDIATCSVAMNELTGTSPVQPGGFRH